MAGEGNTKTTMRAWRYSTAPNGLDKDMQLTNDVPVPAIGKDELLVRVHFMSPNPADYKVAQLPGFARRRIIPGASATPGMDYAGTVERVGEALAGEYAVGDTVFGKVGTQEHGTLGELVNVQREGAAKIPLKKEEGGGGDGNELAFSLAEASCVGTAGMTAWQSLAPYVTRGAGDKVFINGGSGGTGTFGIQIAKALGCHVTTSCSTRNVEQCRALGADVVIDYSQQDVSATLKAEGAVYKHVVDNVGHSPADLYKAADEYLLPEGRYVQIGGGMSAADMRNFASRMLVPSFLGGGRRKIEFLLEKIRHDDLVSVGELMRDGKVKAVVDGTFTFEEAPKAYEKLKTGRSKANIVVKVSE
ncbi:hypothetical protein BX600DRAFT_249808 [Xylariales sp. PMI_506]|nr:hypothetical protein BX600DRAFT_249808 [Xylariales sp. PMI_506]